MPSDARIGHRRAVAATPARLVSPSRAVWAIAGLSVIVVARLANVGIEIAWWACGSERGLAYINLVWDWVVPVTSLAIPFAFLRWLTAFVRDVQALRGRDAVTSTPLGAAVRFSLPIVSWFASRRLLIQLRKETAPGLFPTPEVPNVHGGYRDPPNVPESDPKLSDARIHLWLGTWIAKDVFPFFPWVFLSYIGLAKLRETFFLLHLLVIVCSAGLMIQVISALGARLREQHRRACLETGSVNAADFARDLTTPAVAVLLGVLQLVVARTVASWGVFGGSLARMAGTVVILFTALLVDDALAERSRLIAAVAAAEHARTRHG
jgi:hypothetical protein